MKHDLQHKPKEIKITLDKERTFILDLNAYAEIDLLYKNKSYHEIEKDVIQMRPYALRAFMWGGLVHEDPELTPEYVGQYINVDNIQDYAKKIYEALIHDKPESKSEGSNQENSKKK